jgi:hypothetical protein
MEARQRQEADKRRPEAAEQVGMLRRSRAATCAGSVTEAAAGCVGFSSRW